MLGFLFGNFAGMYGSSTYLSQTTPTHPQVGVDEFDMLQRRVDSLELACAGLWKLLKQQNGWTDEQLQAIIHEVDAADGKADGKISRVGGVCPHCHNRLLSRTSTKCLWCGAPVNQGPFNQSGSESSP